MAKRKTSTRFDRSITALTGARPAVTGRQDGAHSAGAGDNVASMTGGDAGAPGGSSGFVPVSPSTRSTRTSISPPSAGLPPTDRRPADAPRATQHAHATAPVYADDTTDPNAPIGDPTAFRPLEDSALAKGRKFVTLHRNLVTEPARGAGELAKNYYGRAIALLILVALIGGAIFGVIKFNEWQQSDELARQTARDEAIAAGDWNALSTFLEQHGGETSVSDVRDAYAAAFRNEIDRTFDPTAVTERGHAENLDRQLKRIGELETTWRERTGGDVPADIATKIDTLAATSYEDEAVAMLRRGGDLIAADNIDAKRVVQDDLDALASAWTTNRPGVPLPADTQTRIAQDLGRFDRDAGHSLLISVQDALDDALDALNNGAPLVEAHRVWIEARDEIAAKVDELALPEDRAKPISEEVDGANARMATALEAALIVGAKDEAAAQAGAIDAAAKIERATLADWTTKRDLMAEVSSSIDLDADAQARVATALTAADAVVYGALVGRIDNDLKAEYAASLLTYKAGNTAPADVVSAWRTARDQQRRFAGTLALPAPAVADLEGRIAAHDGRLVDDLFAHAETVGTAQALVDVLAAFPDGDPQALAAHAKVEPALVRALIREGRFEEAAQYSAGTEEEQAHVSFAEACLARWRREGRDLDDALGQFKALGNAVFDADDPQASVARTVRLLAAAYWRALEQDAGGRKATFKDITSQVALDASSPTAAYEAFSLGYFLLRDGQYSRAAFVFEQARTVADKVPLAYYNTLARTLAGEGNDAEIVALNRDNRVRGGLSPIERAKAALLWWRTSVRKGDVFAMDAVAALEAMLLDDRGFEAVYGAALAEYNREAGDRMSADELRMEAGFVLYAYQFRRQDGLSMLAQTGRQHASAASLMLDMSETLWPSSSTALASDRIARFRELSVPPSLAGSSFWPQLTVSALTAFWAGFHSFDDRTSRRELDDAYSQFSRLADLTPIVTPFARLYLARITLLRGEPDSAVASLTALVERHPRYADAWYWLGDGTLGANESEDAIDNAIRILRAAAGLDGQVSVATASPAALFRLAELAAERDGEEANSTKEYRAMARRWYSTSNDDYLRREFPIPNW